MMEDLFDSGAMPVLERVVQFTEARQKVLVNDIANISTPYFKPTDLSVAGFQQALAQAIDQRRQTPTPEEGNLPLQNTSDLTFTPGAIDAVPRQTNEGILFHDQNNRDVERLMQHLVENTLAHNTAIEMLRDHFALLQTAISEHL